MLYVYYDEFVGENVMGNFSGKKESSKLNQYGEQGKTVHTGDTQNANLVNVEYISKTPMDILQDRPYQQFSLSDLAVKGACFASVATGIRSMIGDNAGKSGFYYVDTKGLKMPERKDGSGYVGTMLKENGQVGGGTAVLKQLPCDPNTFLVAVALMGIQSKWNTIQEKQQEMMDYLKAQERARLIGDLNTLTDIMNHYPYNWQNDTYRVNKHILVQDIRREAESSIQLCRDQIGKQLQKEDFFHSDQKVRSKLDKIQEEFRDYQLATYLSAFSSLLEALLLGNFKEDYLQSLIEEMRDHALKYRELYTECYNKIERDSQSSVRSVVTKAAASASKGTGETIAKIPGIRKGPVDEALIEAGSKLDEANSDKIDTTMSHMIELSSDGTEPFIQSMETLKNLYNDQTEIYFDEDNLYLAGAF